MTSSPVKFSINCNLLKPDPDKSLERKSMYRTRGEATVPAKTRNGRREHRGWTRRNAGAIFRPARNSTEM